MKRTWLVAGWMTAGWLGGLATAQPATPRPEVNVLPNPSFELEAKGGPADWQIQRWNGEATFEHAQLGHTGKRSLLIASEKGADVAWRTIVDVEPFATYRLSGWVKTENVESTGGKGALFNVQDIQPTTNALTGTNDWTQLEVIFETNEADALQVNCLFGGWGQATGKAWFDDLQLELVRQTLLPEPCITVDAGRVGAPLSKYIYGQFIEHLGRCIYGGIWAEMLEDRKFFLAVGAPESPWRRLNEGDQVDMSGENVFVGAHTPVVTLPGDGQPHGISHGALGLRAGRAYTGRIWLAGEKTAGPVTVVLVWGTGPAARQEVRIAGVTAEYTQTPLQFTAGGDSNDGRLEITASGRGGLRIGAVSLMPADNVHGMRADTLVLLKELDAPIYRWPGGNFVSGYDWRDGLGDPDRRPPRKNPAWQGIEHNDFGLDEFMVFCRELGTEPYITVNSGQGDVQMAVEEVQYANGAADTRMGRRRAANGHPEPYHVEYWSIGNEMYGDWQLGHMPLEQYTQKHKEFAAAMRKADPRIKLVAVGNVGPWDDGMLQQCAEHMDLISEHFYCGSRPGLSGHVRQIADEVRRIAEAHRKYRQDFATLKDQDIDIALDEWNYWYGPDIFGQIGTRYFLRDALGIAGGLNEFARHSDIYRMANYAQTVNVIGAIKTSKTAAAFETTGLVLKLYRAHFGTLPVFTETTPLLNAQAAWTADRRTLTLAVVNPRRTASTITLELRGVTLRGSGTRWEIAGDDPMAYNDPDQPPRVTMVETPVTDLADKLTVAPCSVTLLELGAQ